MEFGYDEGAEYGLGDENVGLVLGYDVALEGEFAAGSSPSTDLVLLPGTGATRDLGELVGGNVEGELEDEKVEGELPFPFKAANQSFISDCVLAAKQ